MAGQAQVIDDVDYTVDEGGSQSVGADAVTGYVPISKRQPAAVFRALKTNVLADLDASSKWRKQATEDLGFISGDQLSEEDKAILDDEGRPHIVFNRVETILKAIAGMEINGRHEIQFLPRNNPDTAMNEVLTAGSKWMADGCDAEDEQSEAFQQSLGTGLGFTESRFAYDDDPEGGYIEEQIDCREMAWDRTARKKNLRDSRRFARLRRMPWADAAEMFPGKTRQQVDAVWANNDFLDDATLKSLEEKYIRDGENSADEFDDRNEVTVVVCQWREKESYYRVADIATNTIKEMSEKEYELVSRRVAMLADASGASLSTLHARKATRWCYYQAFLGNEALLDKVGPAPCGKQFSWGAITGSYDAKKRMWYGIVRVMRDPQLWANKFLSQVQHIMNSTAKGGIIAEADAFDDQREAEDTYAFPQSITWAAPGALSGKKPKIMPKPGQGDPSGYVQLLQYAIQSITAVTGINLELLGQQDQNQPGILEHMRKQAGMTVLATVFDALRGFLKIVGRKRLYFLQTRMSDGRLIRVVGDELAKAIPLARDKTAGSYDVIVADAPTSPNMKEATWATMQPMLVAFKDVLMANPDILASVLEYSPLPSSLVQKLKETALASKNDPQNQQFQETLKQLQIGKLTAEISKDQSAAELNLAKAGSSSATMQYDLAMAQHLIAKNDIEGFTHHITAMAEAAKAEKLKADAAKSHVQAASEAVDMRHKIAMGPQSNDKTDHARNEIDLHKAVTQRLQTHIQARKMGHDVRQQDHANQLDQQRVGIEHMAAQAGMHRDLAAAQRDRVGAVVDARPQPAGAQ